MLTFNLKNKGRPSITQGFGANATSVYKEGGLLGHSGIDYDLGHGTPVKADNAGYVYKVFQPFQLADNWTAVYMLCPTEDPEYFMEIAQGHLQKVLVKTGDTIRPNQIIGLQGNYGTVFASGVRVTVEQQRQGITRGSHVHESWRPVLRVKKPKGHCLIGENGRKYQDKDGYYYQIVNQDNGYKGHIDPLAYSKNPINTNSAQAVETQLRIVLNKTINLLQQKIATLKKEKGVLY